MTKPMSDGEKRFKKLYSRRWYFVRTKRTSPVLHIIESKPLTRTMCGMMPVPELGRVKNPDVDRDRPCPVCEAEVLRIVDEEKTRARRTYRYGHFELREGRRKDEMGWKLIDHRSQLPKMIAWRKDEKAARKLAREYDAANPAEASRPEQDQEAAG